MKKLKEKVKSWKIMKEVVLYRKYKKDKNLKNMVDAYLNGNLVLFEVDKNHLSKESKYCHISLDNPALGFFYCWLYGLYTLYIVDKYNMKAYIEWGKNNPYYEEKGINGTNNAFEYYFQPVSNLTNKDMQNLQNKVELLNARHNFYIIDSDYGELAKINKKYMKLNENVSKSIDDDISKLLKNKKTLAVHIRGVEWGNVEGHPIPLNIDKYIEKIDEALEKHNFEQIFLATDSDDNIEFLSNKYRGKIVFYNDVARASKGSKTLALFDPTIKRENNHYLLGLEVLRDMLTLSYCQGLIAGHSNISAAAIITKLSNDEKYDYKYIFEQKFNKDGISAKKAVEYMKKGKY